MIKTLPITQVRDELTTLVQNARNKLAEYVITVNGFPSAVIISADEYESWKETHAILSDASLMKAIRQGERDVARGNVVSLSDLKKELKLAGV